MIEAIPLRFRTQDEEREVQVFTLKPGEGSLRHQHSFDHSAFVADGVVVFSIGPVDKTAERGDTVHFQSGVEHAFVAQTDAIVVCEFDLRPLGERVWPKP